MGDDDEDDGDGGAHYEYLASPGFYWGGVKAGYLLHDGRAGIPLDREEVRGRKREICFLWLESPRC